MGNKRHLIACLLLTVVMLASAPVRAEQSSEAVFAAAAKYTVKIETSVRLPFRPPDEQGVFSGAGFVVDARRGWVMTNAHVVQSSPATIRMKRRAGTWIPAKRVYVDPYLDVAIVAAAEPGKLSGTTAAALACKELPAVGHPVGAFGHPWGLDYTGTRGVIAGMSDKFEVGALLTDAPINSGNSGGPLISLVTGQVVGVNTSAIVGAQNLNFAVAARYACRILDLLREGRDPSPPEGTLVFFDDVEDTGLLKVARDFTPPGHLALLPGDVIKGVIGEPGPITRESELVHALRGRLDRVTLRIDRAGKELLLSGSLPGVKKLLDRRIVYASGVVFGLRTRFDAAEVNLSKVISCYIEEGTLGRSAGFQRGNAIDTIDGMSVQDLDQVYRLLDQARAAGRPASVVTKQIAGPQGRAFFAYREISLPVEDLRWVSVEE
ncbi:MAG: S1C family serine protease [Sulfuricaulis sp.]